MNSLGCLNRLKKVDKIVLAVHLSIIGFYILYFWVVCQSSFSADDMLNANAKAVDYIPGDSVWKLTMRQFGVWFERGRFFPFSNYCYFLFAYLPSRVAYKFAIVVAVYLNNFLFGKCIQKMSKSREVGLLSMIIFPLCIQLTGEFNSALYCYHMLIQNTFMWMLVSTLFVFKYIDKTREGDKRFRNYWYLAIGAFFLFMSLGTYETAFLLVSFMGLAVWAYTGNLLKTLKVLIPNIITYIAMIFVNVILRMNMTILYSGVEVSFDPKYIFKAYLMQLSSTFPFARFLAIKHKTGVIPYTREDLLATLKWSDLILVVLFVAIVLVVIKMLYKKIQDVQNILFIFLSGLVLLLLPPILIAISARYQQELVWGVGHISGYVQSFGLLIVVIIPVILLIKYCKPIISKIVIVILILLSVLMILCQEMDARVAIQPAWGWFEYPRDNIEAACDFGILNSVSTEDLLIPSADHYFESTESEIFYTYAAKKEIKTIVKAAVPIHLIQKYGNQSIYNLQNIDQKHYAITSSAEKEFGYVILGECKEIILTSNQSLGSINVQSAIIYVRGMNEFTVHYKDSSGIKKIDSSKLELMESDGNEMMYRMNNIEFDIMSVSVE